MPMHAEPPRLAVESGWGERSSWRRGHLALGCVCVETLVVGVESFRLAARNALRRK